MALAAIGARAGAHSRRRVAVPDRLGISARCCRCRSRRRCNPADLALALLYGAADRARLRALAARTRPRRAGLGAVPRRGGGRSALAAPVLRRSPPCWWSRRSRCSRSSSPIDRRIASIFVVAAAGVFVLLRLVASLLMAVARRLPRPRSTVAAAGDRQYPPPGRAHAERRAVARARPRAAGHRDRDRRQSAPPVPGGAAGARRRRSSSSTSRPRTPNASTPSSMTHAPGATLERVPMLRGRIVAANGVRGRGDQAAARQPPGCCRATAASPMPTNIPAGSRVIDGEWWPPDYPGPPLVSFEKRIADGLGLTIGDTGDGQRARPQHRTRRVANLRTLDWQSLGINFVMVFSPTSFRGAPHTHHRHADLSRRQHDRAGDRAAARRPPTPSRRSPRCACAEAVDFGRRLVDQPGAGAARRQRAHAADRRAGARRRAGGRAPAPRLRRRRAQDRRRDPRQAAGRLRARIPDARRRHRGVRRGGRHRRRRVRGRQGHEPAVHLAARPRSRRRRRRGAGDGGARA